MICDSGARGGVEESSTISGGVALKLSLIIERYSWVNYYITATIDQYVGRWEGLGVNLG